MNIKEILGLGLLFVAISSCSEESPIDDRPYETGTVTLNFTMQGVTETKGAESIGSTEIYTHTTEAERSVKNCVIAIFAKGKKGEWNKHIYSHFYKVESKTGAFKITDLVLPINTDLKILAIANDPRVSDPNSTPEGKISSTTDLDRSPEGWTEYSAWKNAFAWHQLPPTSPSENKDYCTFNPRNLIKVGELEMRFNAKGQLVDNSNNIKGDGVAKVPLIQLASKIFLELNLEKYESINLNKPIEIKNVRLYSGILSYWNRDDYPVYEDKNPRNVDDDYTYLSQNEYKTIEVPFYTYAKKDEGITILLEGTMKGTNKKNQYKIDLMPDEGFLRGYYYEVKGTLKVDQNIVVRLKWKVSDWGSKNINIPFN